MGQPPLQFHSVPILDDRRRTRADAKAETARCEVCYGGGGLREKGRRPRVDVGDGATETGSPGPSCKGRQGCEGIVRVDLGAPGVRVAEVFSGLQDLPVLREWDSLEWVGHPPALHR